MNKYPHPLCLLCSQILSNDAMKPSKLIRHFYSKHNNLKSKPLEYFERLLSEKTTHENQMKKITSTDKFLVHDSYHISFQIAKTKKPYRIGEELVMPRILTATEDLLGPKTAKKLLAYHSLTTPFNEGLKTWQKMLNSRL